jgi:hypothetical protein
MYTVVCSLLITILYQKNRVFAASIADHPASFTVCLSADHKIKSKLERTRGLSWRNNCIREIGGCCNVHSRMDAFDSFVLKKSIGFLAYLFKFFMDWSPRERTPTWFSLEARASVLLEPVLLPQWPLASGMPSQHVQVVAGRCGESGRWLSKGGDGAPCDNNATHLLHIEKGEMAMACYCHYHDNF